MSQQDYEIKKAIINLLKMRNGTLEFTNELSKAGDLLFFGGSVRDLYVNNVEEYPRDFDIAINFKDNHKFRVLLEKYEHKLNRFGGYKFNICNTEFDVWDLNSTWAFKNTNLTACEENLVSSVFLNVDGVVFNFNKSKLYANGINQSLESKEIDIVLENNPQVELNLLRALVFKKKYNLGLSSRIQDLLTDFNKKNKADFLESLHGLQFGHYKTEKISKSEIAKELQSLTVV